MPLGQSIKWNICDLDIRDLGLASMLEEKPALPEIRHVHFNEKTGHTAIVWKDGTSTVVHCGVDEKFEPYAGFCAAIVKKLFGSTTAAKRKMDSLDVAKVAAAKKEAKEKEAAETREREAKNHERKVRSMAKRLKLVNEASELYMKENGVKEAIDDAVDSFMKLLDGAVKDGDRIDVGTV